MYTFQTVVKYDFFLFFCKCVPKNLCTGARFRALGEALGEGFEAVEIDSGKGNAHGIPRTAHSVLTKDLVDTDGHPTRQALERVVGFFREELSG